MNNGASPVDRVLSPCYANCTNTVNTALEEVPHMAMVALFPMAFIVILLLIVIIAILTRR